MNCVVDANILVSYLHSDDLYHNASRSWIHGQAYGGQLMVAPILLLVEVGAAVARRTWNSVFGH